MRQSLIAGNWKMNTTLEEGTSLVTKISNEHGQSPSVQIIVAPPSTHLYTINEQIKTNVIGLAGQTLHEKDNGAYTGELSGPMLRSVGCEYVIVGHSERREYFTETNSILNTKLLAAFRHQLTPIYCVGETLTQRESNQTFDVIKTQLKEGLSNLTSLLVDQSKEIIIAYEPVWAIGTGKVATTEQAQEVHHFIRAQLNELFNATVAESTRVLYGGSVKPDNIEGLISQPDIDGALVGGASLDATSFNQIINTCQLVGQAN